MEISEILSPSGEDFADFADFGEPELARIEIFMKIPLEFIDSPWILVEFLLFPLNIH